MAKPKKTWFAILGLLSWRPMSGYEIKKFVENALSFFWSESYGQVYPTLKALVDAGLAKKLPRDGLGSRRQRYSITERGKRELAKWLSSPSEPPKSRNEFELKFFLNSSRPQKHNLKLVEEYRSQQQELLKDFLESEKLLKIAVRNDALPEELLESMPEIGDSDNQQLTVFYLTLRHGIHAARARIAWCNEVLSFLQS